MTFATLAGFGVNIENRQGPLVAGLNRQDEPLSGPRGISQVLPLPRRVPHHIDPRSVQADDGQPTVGVGGPRRRIPNC